MSPQIVFNLFKKLGKFIPATGYFKLSINGCYWEARDLQSDGGISFYDYFGAKKTSDEVWAEINQ
jgi:hypothetical protein